MQQVRYKGSSDPRWFSIERDIVNLFPHVIRAAAFEGNESLPIRLFHELQFFES